MSKYDKDTKFYWLQLKEDFFEDDAIEWLEEQKPNGRDYAYFYLKLCLKSLKSNGVLVRKVGKILIPYDNQKLAELTKMDFDTVTVAMELLKKIGLIQILENGEIYINQLENLIGSKSIGAFKKQQQRLLGGQKEDSCPPKIEIELEKEIEIEKDIKKEKNKKRKTFEEVIAENNCSEELESTVRDFIDMRKTIKKPMTSKALELLFKNLEKLTNLEEEKIAILNQSIEHSWQTVYPLKTNNMRNSSKGEIKEEEKQEELKEIDISGLTTEEYDLLVKKKITIQDLIKKGRINV